MAIIHFPGDDRYRETYQSKSRLHRDFVLYSILDRSTIHASCDPLAWPLTERVQLRVEAEESSRKVGT